MTQRAAIACIFAVVLIDMLGFGVVTPVLPGLIIHLAHVPIGTAARYAGWLSAGYAVMQFVFAPVIGNLSDRFGRRPVLLAAVFALSCEYLLQYFAPVFAWLIVGRLLTGVTGASFSAAYAYLADITPPERRAASFGLVGVAFSLGFIIGPALGGVLGAIDPRLPFLAAALLALGNFLFGLFVLRESLPVERRRRFDWRRANALAALGALAGQSRAVVWMVAALGTWQLATIVYPSMWSFMAIAAWGFSPGQIGLALTVVGLSSAAVQSLGLRRVLPRIGERRAVMLGVGGHAAAALLYTLAHGMPMVMVAIVVGALQGFVQPSIAGLSSRTVDARSQGELQGASQAIAALAQIAGPPLYAQALALGSGASALIMLPTAPMVVSAAIGAAALLLFLAGARTLAPQPSSSTSQ